MNTTAGKGDPYWYEWTVGLVKVVEMLHPDSKIQTVSFQVEGFKGWDDVVVKYTDGRRDFIQVKNSRTDANITFGTLVGVDNDGVSLLSSLFDAWKEMKLRPQLDKCFVFTNRTAGENA
ncbi:MAG: hypothetical protein JWM68_5667, partial [Verrucomicrobiales bacterium]|nr:hypothetical protein [Verrucomicrobiales bacterium]